MIDVYFIRHGETGGNLAKRHQAEKTRLTPEGKEQARSLIPIIENINPTHVLASSRVRALQTANIATETLGIIPETSPMLVELKRPDVVYGYHHKSVRSMWYLIAWYFGFLGGDGTNSDGESYKEFRERIAQVQVELAMLPDNSRVVVVSHAVFIGFFVAHLCNTTSVSFSQAWGLFRNVLGLRNASVTHVQYNPNAQPNTCAWQLITYNQHAHTNA